MLSAPSLRSSIPHWPSGRVLSSGTLTTPLTACRYLQTLLGGRPWQIGAPRRPGGFRTYPSRGSGSLGGGGGFAVFAGGFALAGVCALAMLLAVHAYVRGAPAGADMAAIDEPLVQSVPETNAEDDTLTRPRADQAAAVTKPAPQRFAWAPSPGATAYHVELFRGSAKVFDADTQHTVITIPARWTFDGRTRALGPGEYRWYVWPLVSGIRATRAIVQARLSFQGMKPVTQRQTAPAVAR